MIFQLGLLFSPVYNTNIEQINYGCQTVTIGSGRMILGYFPKNKSRWMESEIRDLSTFRLLLFFFEFNFACFYTSFEFLFVSTRSNFKVVL